MGITAAARVLVVNAGSSSGTLYTAPVLITDEVRRRLETLTDLAPLHQPRSLAALDAVTSVLPEVQAVACFDSPALEALPCDRKRQSPLRLPANFSVSIDFPSVSASHFRQNRRENSHN
jgi:hypothetical protein